MFGMKIKDAKGIMGTFDKLVEQRVNQELDKRMRKYDLLFEQLGVSVQDTEDDKNEVQEPPPDGT